MSSGASSLPFSSSWKACLKKTFSASKQLISSTCRRIDQARIHEQHWVIAIALDVGSGEPHCCISSRLSTHCLGLASNFPVSRSSMNPITLMRTSTTLVVLGLERRPSVFHRFAEGFNHRERTLGVSLAAKGTDDGEMKLPEGVANIVQLVLYRLGGLRRAVIAYPSKFQPSFGCLLVSPPPVPVCLLGSHRCHCGSLAG